jgi:hypothetical protein
MGANGEANATEGVEGLAGGRDLVDRARAVLASSHTTGGSLSCAADAFTPSVMHAFAAYGDAESARPAESSGTQEARGSALHEECRRRGLLI